jgi:hypothetical protein
MATPSDTRSRWRSYRHAIRPSPVPLFLAVVSYESPPLGRGSRALFCRAPRVAQSLFQPLGLIKYVQIEELALDLSHIADSVRPSEKLALQSPKSSQTNCRLSLPRVGVPVCLLPARLVRKSYTTALMSAGALIGRAAIGTRGFSPLG